MSSTEVMFAASAYAVDTVKKAAYRLLDKCAVEVVPSESEILCRVSFDKPVTPDFAYATRQQLQKEVLDQDLRKTVARETEPLRNLILSYAFSRTSLVEKA